jgi:hypothetical protein
MNELLLIDMMSELNPELLEDDYIEKDMKRGKVPFYRWFLNLKKSSKQSYEFSVENPVSEESNTSDDINASKDSNASNYDLVVAEDINTAELLNETGESEENRRRWGFSISIFEKKFRNLFKIVSGIAATIIVIISIIVILLRRHKSGVKLHAKKIQIIY